MAVLDSLLDLLTKRDDTKFMYDIDWMDVTDNKVYAKRMAIDKVVEFIARAISTTEFRFMDGDDLMQSPWSYKLNVRPNTDKSAANFWQDLIYKLIKENEVLVIKNDSDDLLVAESFVRTERANYPDTFSGVTVKNFTFQRTFNMDQVWYMTYNNNKLNRFVDAMWSDYGELFGRLMEINLRNNQIRGTIKTDLNSGTQDEKAASLQKFIDKIFNSFKHNSVALVPLTKGFEYNEVSGTAGEKNQAVSELTALIDGFTNEVANMLGVPPALIHGQTAEVDQNNKAFVTYCVKPLLKKIRDELNAKLFTQKEYEKGKHVMTFGIGSPDPYKDAEAIDKLVASRVFNPNTVLKDYGYPTYDGGDEYILTKNYDTATKGGEKNANNN
jgi:HK97 family phage portal protein